MTKLRVFYAHCIAIYGTKEEERDIELLEGLGFEVDNPNNPEYSDAYAAMGMHASVGFIGNDDALAFKALPDGSLPAGVAKEINIAKDMGYPIFEIPNYSMRKTLTVDQTRAYIKECGKR